MEKVKYIPRTSNDLLMVILGCAFLFAGAFPIHTAAQNKNTSTVPVFSQGFRIQANGTDLVLQHSEYQKNLHLVPCVADWNGDDRKDLLVGCFYYGNVYLFLNSGTNSDPLFTTGTKLQADGSDLTVDWG